MKFRTSLAILWIENNFFVLFLIFDNPQIWKNWKLRRNISIKLFWSVYKKKYTIKFDIKNENFNVTNTLKHESCLEYFRL
jgi:hypothetical protein